MSQREILRLIGRNIRQARTQLGLTQECVAELIGIHWKTLGYIERGSYPFSVVTFAQLAQFLETSPNRLLDGLPAPDPKRTARIKKALTRKRAPAQSARAPRKTDR